MKVKSTPTDATYTSEALATAAMVAEIDGVTPENQKPVLSSLPSAAVEVEVPVLPAIRLEFLVYQL